MSLAEFPQLEAVRQFRVSRLRLVDPTGQAPQLNEQLAETEVRPPREIGTNILELASKNVDTDTVIPGGLVITTLKVEKPKGIFQRRRKPAPEVVIGLPEGEKELLVKDVLAQMSPEDIGFGIGKVVQAADSVSVVDIMTVYTDLNIDRNGRGIAHTGDGRAQVITQGVDDRAVYPTFSERQRVQGQRGNEHKSRRRRSRPRDVFVAIR